MRAPDAPAAQDFDDLCSRRILMSSGWRLKDERPCRLLSAGAIGLSEARCGLLRHDAAQTVAAGRLSQRDPLRTGTISPYKRGRCAPRMPHRPWRQAPLLMRTSTTHVVGVAAGRLMRPPRTRAVGCAKRNEYFPGKTRFTSRGSSLYVLQKSGGGFDLVFDPEDRFPRQSPENDRGSGRDIP